LPALGRALADLDETAALTGAAIDPTARAALERAAPIYRKAWWPAHRAANRVCRSSVEELVDRHGRTILDFITRAYALGWPAGGYPVHVSAYANWAGAYSSTRSNMLVVSSLDKATQGLRGLETIFHEPMHQWDNQVFAALGVQGKALKVSVPRDLPHAMIFFTAGEAVRRALPEYVPTADAFDIWRLQLSGSSLPAARLKPLLQQIWLPYLDGRGTRDEALAALLAAAAQASGTSPIFTIETDEFWLNLHHFLYVLGRAEAKIRDASRSAVVDAPAEAERGAVTLSDEERKTWADAVTAYASGLSRKDPIVDESLAAIVGALVALDGGTAISGAPIDSAARTVLERAAPIYRKAWWPSHRASNQSWRASIQPLIDRHGQTVLSLITRWYGMSWPARGYPVHLVTYAHPLGAYSTARGGLIMSTNAKSGLQGLNGLEMAFHEAMHQWDDDVLRLLRGHADKIGKDVPDSLPHAMIWMTAGEAVRGAVPEHVPYAEVFGLWKRAMAPLVVPLNEIWKPYLEGHGTRDEALASLVAVVTGGPRR